MTNMFRRQQLLYMPWCDDSIYDEGIIILVVVFYYVSKTRFRRRCLMSLFNYFCINYCIFDIIPTPIRLDLKYSYAPLL